MTEAGRVDEARPYIEALLPQIEGVGGRAHTSLLRVQAAPDALPAAI